MNIVGLNKSNNDKKVVKIIVDLLIQLKKQINKEITSSFDGTSVEIFLQGKNKALALIDYEVRDYPSCCGLDTYNISINTQYKKNSEEYLLIQKIAYFYSLEVSIGRRHLQLITNSDNQKVIEAVSKADTGKLSIHYLYSYHNKKTNENFRVYHYNN